MVRRALLALALLVGVAVVQAPSADAAGTGASAIGWVSSARLDTFDHTLVVNGHAYLPDHAGSSIAVRLFVDGHYRATVQADLTSTAFDSARHISGKHDFHFARHWTAAADAITLRAVRPDNTTVALKGLAVTHVVPAPAVRVITVAKEHVGDPYVEGGSTPRGFDCSGFTRYVYAQAGVRTLPHNAESQRRMAGMRRIARTAARPGDLVFYLAGGSAYHVAIYAGHGMQYAATTPGEGVRYQIVWSSAVQYGTLLH